MTRQNWGVFLVASIVWLCLAATPPYPSTISIPNIAALTGHTFGGTLSNISRIHVAGYTNPSDGGQGDFLPCATPHAADGGRYVLDASANCYQRDNLNGDIRQYGATIGAAYDCSPTTGSGPSTCTAVDTIFTSIKTAAAAAGLTTISFGSMQVKFASSPVIPTKMALDCGANIGKNNNDGLYTNFPGTLILSHGATLTPNEFNAVSNCLVIHKDYLTASPFTTIRQQLDYWGPGGTAVTDADTGITLENSTGCRLYHVMVLGFDAGIQLGHNGDCLANDVQIDANVGWLFYHLRGDFWINDYRYEPFTTHQINNIVCVDSPGTYPGCTYSDRNTVWWTITSIVNSGGQCALESTEHSISYIHTGDIVQVSKLADHVGCMGRWTVTVSGSDVILNGSSYTGPTTTGSFESGKFVIHDIASMTNIAIGQSITGVAGITNGTLVVGVDPVSKYVQIDQVTTGAGSGVSIPFSNNTAAFLSKTCNGTGKGTCLWLSAQGRTVAGNSFAGVYANNIATGLMSGGPSTDDKASGVRFKGVMVYGPTTFYRFSNTTNNDCVLCAADDDGNVDDPAQTAIQVDGDTTTITFVGGKLGKTGTSVKVNSTDTAEAALHLDNVATNATSGNLYAMQVDDGSIIVTGGHGGGNFMFGHLIGAAIFNGTLFPTSAFYYENDATRGKVNGGSNVFLSGYTPGVSNNAGSGVIREPASTTAGSYTMSGATLDTTGLTIGMNIVPPTRGSIPNGTEVDSFTAPPCTPSCTVTMTNFASANDSGTFTFQGAVTPSAQRANANWRVIGTESADSLWENDTWGGTPMFGGVRANGTMGAPTATTAGQAMSALVGFGYGSTGFDATPSASVELQACETHTDTANCGTVVLKATEAGGTALLERARAENAGFGIGTGAGVASLLEIIQAAPSFTFANINALGTGTGDVTLTGSGSFPSPGTLLVENEWISYKKKTASAVTITARGVFGSSAATHANGLALVYATSIYAPSTSTTPLFATLSDGRVVNVIGPLAPALAQTGAAVTTPADTSEDTLATISVPANALGSNGCAVVDLLGSWTASANLKSLKVYLGNTGTTAFGILSTSSNLISGGRANVKICNSNATNAQIGGMTTVSFGAAGATVTGAIDTTSAANIIITGQKASGGETLTLAQYSIVLMPHS